MLYVENVFVAQLNEILDWICEMEYLMLLAVPLVMVSFSISCSGSKESTFSFDRAYSLAVLSVIEA